MPRPSRIVASIVTLTAMGCGNPTKSAVVATAYDTLTVYSLNSAQPFQPTAFYMAMNQLVVPDGTITFDFALNIEHGAVVVYPPKLVVTAFGAARVVGLQVLPQSFDAITIANHNGYEFNDSLLVTPGQAWEVVSRNTNACVQLNITSQELLYGKFIVDSVNVPLGQIHMRGVVDPNCDFDTLVPGVIPTH